MGKSVRPPLLDTDQTRPQLVRQRIPGGHRPDQHAGELLSAAPGTWVRSCPTERRSAATGSFSLE